jgi:ubiquinol-cytochrome c reductase cytochrome b subunit
MAHRFSRYLLDFRWGGNSLAALYISVLSGMVLAWQYDPNEPYYSSGTLELVAPFGSFWRSCHFYSSQAFFLLLLGHFVVVVSKRCLACTAGAGQDPGVLSARPGEGWGRLYLTLPVSLLLLFTGYVLRGDATGQAAGAIGENIAETIPVLGHWLNLLFFNVSQAGMRVVYADHLIGLDLACGMLAWHHLRRYRIRIGDFGLLLAGVLALNLFLPAPFDPFRVGVFQITGPWFFVGVQELLRFLPSFWGGIVFPSIGLAWGYLVLTRPGERRHQFGLAAWLILYLILTVLGWN